MASMASSVLRRARCADAGSFWLVYGTEQTIVARWCKVHAGSPRESILFNFDVNDMMECDCEIAIVKAVMAVDANASVYIDMETRGVEVTSTSARALEIREAIVGAGYTPTLMQEPEPLQVHRRAPPRMSLDGAGHDFGPGRPSW